MTQVEILKVVVEGINKNFSRVANDVSKSLRQIKLQFHEYNQVMNMSEKGFNKLADSQLRLGTIGARTAQTFRQGISVLRNYRMEMLGVIFFTMYLQNMFNNLLRPAMETYGIFDLFSTMLLVMFLPVMEMIFPYFLGLMEFFMDLPEPVQKVIGVFVLIALIIAKIVSTLVIFGLGLSTLFDLKIFTGLLKIVKFVFKGIASFIGLTVLAIIGTVIGLWLSFRDNFNNINEWWEVTVNGIKKVWEGIVDGIIATFNFFVSLFKGDVEGMKNAFIDSFEALKTFFSGVVETLLGLAVTLGTGLLRIIVDIGKKIWNFGYDMGKDLINGMIDGIKSLASSLWSAITSAKEGRGSSGSSTTSSFTGTRTMDDVRAESSPTVMDFARAGLLTRVQDFILQPGGRLIKTDPNDTIVGTKGGTKGVTINQTNNISGTLMSDIDRAINEANKRLVDDIKRMSGA